ncbi:MAG: response regulator [Proteobacteria bacterium]|jgi:DNA-binding NtrC family response regulator|nr:response regulator [Pseudomonadota bacterium]
MSANTIPPSAPAGTLVFIVDDNELLGEITAQLIANAGYRTRLFQQGLPARDAMLAASTPPEVLVTDFDIGDINGLDLIGEVRAKHPQLKTLLVSGTAAPEAIAAHPIKPDAFLAKPFIADTLIGSVDRLVAQTRGVV